MNADRTTWTTTGGDRVTVWQDDAGLWRWNVKAGNNEVVGSGEAHPDRRDAETAALRHHPRVEP
jgi:hypothetical protein